MGTQLIGDFGAHPYAPVLFGLTGLDYSNKGGFAFYSQLLQLMAVIPSVQQVQAGLITGAQAAAVLQAYGGIVAGINAMPDMTVPVDLRGTLSDQHVRTKSQALYGEMYFDLNEDTMLTIGARYDDFLVDSSNFNDLVGRQYVARGGNAYANPRDIPGMLQKRTVTDTSSSYKVALQHYLSEDVMVYGSYTTATKAGGVNAGSSSSTYDPEETGVLDLGLKGIFLDGAMLLNMNLFRNDNKGMLLAAIVDLSLIHI